MFQKHEMPEIALQIKYIVLYLIQPTFETFFLLIEHSISPNNNGHLRNKRKCDLFNVIFGASDMDQKPFPLY